jgi:hypothetical protein
MINRTPFVWILRLIFLGAALASAGFLVQTSGIPSDILDVYGLLHFLWGPVAAGVTAVTCFYVIFEKWLWRWPIMRGWLVQLPDLTGTWLAISLSETFPGPKYYSLVTIDHGFDRLTYRAWRPESTVKSVACSVEKKDQDIRVFVAYENEVGVSPAKHGIDHEGCLRMTLLNKRCQKIWKLEGEYWTNKQRVAGGPRDRGTVGKIFMTWVCRDLVDEDSEVAKKHFQGERRPHMHRPSATT